MEKDENYKVNSVIELKGLEDLESKRSKLIIRNGESQDSNRSDAILNSGQKSHDSLKIEYNQSANKNNNNNLFSSAISNKNDRTEINDKSDQNILNISNSKFYNKFSEIIFQNKISKRYLAEKQKHEREELEDKIKVIKKKI